MSDDNAPAEPKRGRGRPKKQVAVPKAEKRKASVSPEAVSSKKSDSSAGTPVKRGRGRPKGTKKKGRKAVPPKVPGRGRGRPKKVKAKSSSEDEAEGEDTE